MKFDEQENTIRCCYSGDLDSETCSSFEPQLNKKISGFLGERDQGEVVFDLRDVSFISSSFLRLCLFYCKLAGTDHFRIEGASTNLIKIFQIAGFAELMNVS